MDQMKLPPLRHRKWSEHRMIENPCVLSEFSFAPRHDSFHVGNLLSDLCESFLQWQSSRNRNWGRFHASWEISNMNNHKSADPLLQGGHFAGSFPRIENSCQSLRRSGVR